MVVVRDARFPVWGWAAPGTAVRVRFRGAESATTADAAGRWRVELGPFPAGGPDDLEVDGPRSVRVRDVLTGDVWLCAGQSNMGMGITLANDGRAEAERANVPRLRLAWVPTLSALEPRPTADVRWRVCTPRSVLVGEWGGFSAAAYYFGRQLEHDLGVPVGLIQATWGGTWAEAWMSAEALRRLGWYGDELDERVRRAAGTRAGTWSYPVALADWFRLRDPGSAASPGWEAFAADDAAWPVMDAPRAWETGGLPGYHGVVWFRATRDLPAAWAGRPAVLRLGRIDVRDAAWVNGAPVGSTDDPLAERAYPVPAGVLRAGRNVIAIRVLNGEGPGGLRGPADRMRLEAPGSGSLPPVPLAGPWRARGSRPLAGVPAPPDPPDRDCDGPAGLFNAMIAPLAPLGLTGVAWYQGEANANHPARYRDVLAALVADWRGRFERPLPFLVVQLAGYREPPRDAGGESGWADLRAAQAAVARAVPRVALVTAVDLGDATSIHPREKREVGRRLALAAEGAVAGRPVEWSGPVERSAHREGRAVRVAFDHAAGGLAAREGVWPAGFALAGPDGRWAWAAARLDGDSVLVWSRSVPDPVAVRYAWAQNPPCSLYGCDGLPAFPFRADGLR